jgi:hypothetical protein
VECPHCGAENDEAAAFCTLCLARFGKADEPAGGGGAIESGHEPDADFTPAYREQMLEDAEMWSRRREMMDAEHVGSAGDDLDGDTAAAEHELVELTAVEVSVENAAARHTRRVALVWVVGLFALACAVATWLAYRFDWTSLASTAAPGLAEVSVVAVRSLPTAFGLWVRMTAVLFLGGAIASFTGAARTGEFRTGVVPVAIGAGLECLVLLPWLLDAPSKTPVTDLFTFAVVVSVGLGVVGAAIGASIGRIAARRD